MFDNGLLKYYNKQSAPNGYLNTTGMGDISLLTRGREITTCKIDNKSFYAKKYPERTGKYEQTLNKYQQDAEILLSQLYTKFGLNSAIYTPATMQDKTFLLSNDVTDDNTQVALEFLLNKDLKSFLYNSSLFDTYRSRKHFTKDCIIKQTKMRILDVASFNSDRHFCNFFYTIKSNEQDDNRGNNFLTRYFGNKSKAEDIKTIDHEASGENIMKIVTEGYICPYYKSDFSPSWTSSREETLYEMQNNKNFGHYIDRHKVGEELGALNPKEVAEDIYETIGYEVEPKMVETLEKSYNEVADNLCQN